MSRSGERTAFLEMGKAAADFKALAHFHLSRRGHRLPPGQRLDRDRRHGGRALLDSHHVRDCPRNQLQPDRARGGRHTQGTPPPGADGSRIAAAPGPPASMAALAEMGAILAPPMPAFYLHPQTVADIVEHSVERVMALAGAAAPKARRSGKETDEARQTARQMRVAFQGELGAFSQQAIRQLLGLRPSPSPTSVSTKYLPRWTPGKWTPR